MYYAFSGELQQIVETEIPKEKNTSEDELLFFLSGHFVERKADIVHQLQAEVQDRIDSLDRGEGIEFDNKQTMRDFAHEIKAEGRRSWESSQNRP